MAGRTVTIQGNIKSKGVLREKPKSMRKSWGMIIKYMRSRRIIFFFAMTMVFLESLFTVSAPNMISDLADLISDGLYTGDIDLDGATRLALIIASIYLLGTLAMFLRNYIMADLAQHVAGDMRSDLNRKMSRMPLRFFDGSRKGDIMSRFTNDADTVGTALNRSISVFAHGIVLFVLCIIFMAFTNPILTVVAVASSVSGMLLSAFVVKRTQRFYREQQRNLGSMYGLISEIYSTHDIVMSYCGADLNREKFDKLNRSLRASGFRSEITMGLLPAIMSFIGNLGYVLVCIVGSVMVIEGQITIGVVVAFIVYVRLFGGPLDMIANSLGNMQAAGAGAERIFEFLGSEEMPEEKDTVVPVDVKGKVEFKDVHFGYNPGIETIKGFSVSVEPGQKVAIVGSTGAGKTTIVNLLMKFYDVWEGDILIDGVSIKSISRESVHDMFCMVLQDSWLFEGTIRENIAYSRDISDERIREACLEVGIDKFIDSLPEGINTRIGSRSNLSEGQKQQICIARALVDDSPMLILDEATSSVDTRTEMLIQKAIDSMMGGRTSFVIAHRLSTVRNADIILVMKDGNIVEKGTHEELLASGGVYSDLYHSQFEIEE